MILMSFLPIILLVAFSRRFWSALLVAAGLPTAISLVRLAYSATELAQFNQHLRRITGLNLRFGKLQTRGLVIRAIIVRL